MKKRGKEGGRYDTRTERWRREEKKKREMKGGRNVSGIMIQP